MTFSFPPDYDEIRARYLRCLQQLERWADDSCMPAVAAVYESARRQGAEHAKQPIDESSPDAMAQGIATQLGYLTLATLLLDRVSRRIAKGEEI